MINYTRAMHETNDVWRAAPQVIWVPYADDPLRVLAQQICATYRQYLPDLTAVLPALPSRIEGY